MPNCNPLPGAVRFSRLYSAAERQGRLHPNGATFKVYPPRASKNWHSQRVSGEQADLTTIQEILPWYGMNALVHFLTPYGLEQFNGAAWGTRDVCQGPFEMLLAFRKFDAAKQVLRIVFSNQNPDGGWPQWWMFDRYSEIRAESAHSDILHWCLIALCKYIEVSGDIGFLEEMLPYCPEEGSKGAVRTSLNEHVDRLIHKIVHSYISGTNLVPFGGGDWNDSMQPVSSDLAQCLVSS